MKTTQEIATSIIEGRHLFKSNQKAQSPECANSTLSEQYVSWMPVPVIVDVYQWLKDNEKLDGTDFELAIQTAICLGNREDLEDAFPAFTTCNPVYSFRRFNIAFTTIEPTERHRGWIEIELQELDINGQYSPLIKNISGCLNYMILHHPEVIELLHEQSAVLRKQEHGIMKYGIKLPKRQLSISIPTEVLERVFITEEKQYQSPLPRPYYMKLSARSGAEILLKPTEK